MTKLLIPRAHDMPKNQQPRALGAQRDRFRSLAEFNAPPKFHSRFETATQVTVTEPSHRTSRMNLFSYFRMPFTFTISSRPATICIFGPLRPASYLCRRLLISCGHYMHCVTIIGIHFTALQAQSSRSWSVYPLGKEMSSRESTEIHVNRT
jgi:hypothetical protein